MEKNIHDDTFSDSAPELLNKVTHCKLWISVSSSCFLSPVEWSTVVYYTYITDSSGHYDDKDTFDQRVAVCLHALQRPWRLNKRDDGNLIYCSLHTQWHLSKEFFYTGFKVVIRMKYDRMSACFCDIVGTLSGPVVLWGPRSDPDTAELSFCHPGWF